jgi:excisionase family DNA binding protein
MDSGVRTTEWLTIRQVAERVGCGRTTVHRAADDGALAYATTPVGRLFHVDDVDEWKTRRARAFTERGGKKHG